MAGQKFVAGDERIAVKDRSFEEASPNNTWREALPVPARRRRTACSVTIPAPAEHAHMEADRSMAASKKGRVAPR